MMKLSVALLVVALVYQASAAPTVDSALLKSLQQKKSANILLSMAERGTTKKVLAQLETRTFSTLADKRVQIGAALKAQAAESQSEVLAFLATQPEATGVTQLWITNQVIIRGASLELVEKLMSRKDISAIEEEFFVPLDQPIDVKVGDNGKADEQWGVINIDAPSIWSQGNTGKGVIIGSIDTGVRATHEALRDNYRGAYGWYDPSGKTSTPTDKGGHGTHTMGTIVGRTRGVGVAPDATWMSCLGCVSSCSSFDLTECGQFMACPTNPQGGAADCSQAPSAVSNSWGGGNGDTWYEDVIRTWRAAGIIPLFSIGNAGPYCGSANSPGDSELVIGIGSTTDANTLSSFSSVGPTYRGNRIKPDISAPGSNVFSAYNTGDSTYATMSGTSMACPHTAGLVALLFSERPNLTYDQVKSSLERGALNTTPTGRNCGSINESQYPNHHVGYGRINAVNSISEVRAL